MPVECLDVLDDPEEMLQAGFDVRFVDGPDGADSAADKVESVDADVFCKWLELREMQLGSVVAKWWKELQDGDDCCGQGEAESMLSFFAKVAECAFL